jgi:hypothetical protein
MSKLKPYIELRDFPDLTPFTEQAIRGHMQRGELVEGTHYFRIGRRVVFKWTAIVEWIERRAGTLQPPDEALANPLLAPAADIVPLRSRA